MNKKDKSKSDIDSTHLTGCICPEKCLINKPIDAKNPADAQKMLCSNSKCDQTLFIHRTCFDSWENILVENVLKSRRTRGRDWTDSQWRHNLWLKKGYEMIFAHCACPCSGHLRKDVDYVTPPSADDQANVVAAAPKQKTKKQNQLPKLGFNYQKVPIGKNLPGVQITAGTYRNRHTTDYGWSEFDPPSTTPLSSSWNEGTNSMANGSSTTRSATLKSYIVKPSIDNEKDLIQLLQELLKTNGIPLKVSDGRILTLFAQANAQLITKIQSDECGGILNWAKSKKQFYIDRDFIDLIERAPATRPKPQQTLKSTFDPSLSQNGWQVAVGRRAAKATSFSLADLDDFQLASFDSRSSSSYEECMSSTKSPTKKVPPIDVGASGDGASDVRPNVGGDTGHSIDDEEENNEEFYPALSSPEMVINGNGNGHRSAATTFDFNVKLQEMYGQFLSCSQQSSIELTYAYGRLANDIEKLCESIKK